jgi:hypothetical protein
MNKQHWFIRNSVHVAMAALLLAAANGCGSSSSEEEYEAPLPGDVMTEAEMPPIGQTNELGETLCSELDLGVDEYGRQFVDREIYHFGLINDELERYPELAEGTGFTNVSDCESARAYAPKYAEFSAAHPNFRGEPSKQESFSEFLSDPTNVGKPNPDGPEVEKVFGGAIGDRPAVVRTARPLPDGKYDYCSAVRIAGPLFVTAAHCMPNFSSGQTQSYQLYIGRRNSSGNESWVGGPGGKVLNVYGVPLHGFAGINANEDFGLIFVLPMHHQLLNQYLEASATTLLASRSPAVNDGQLVYGWGASDETEPRIDWRLRTPAPQPTLHGIDSVGSEAWSIQDTGPAIRMCKGDSGGAALRDGMLDGITSVVLPRPVNTICSAPGHQQYWTRVDTKVSWLRQAMAGLQHGSTKTPFRCVFHSGNPSDPNDWEHIISYINCNEK